MATYYISPSGNDTTGTGAIGAPWLTFAKFLAASASGDTCIARAGTYTLSSFSIANRTLQAYTNETVIFDGGGARVSVLISGTVTLQDIRFQNALGPSGSGSGFFQIVAANTVLTFTRCRFKTITIDSTNTQFLRNYPNNCTYTVEGCEFNDVIVSGGASDFFQPAVTTNVVAFRNNSFYFKNLGTNTNVVNGSSGVGSLSWLNNIVKNGSAYAVTVLANCSGYTITPNNNCSNNATLGASGTGNITSDPLFIDAANGNFRLRPTSPCLNAGVNP